MRTKNGESMCGNEGPGNSDTARRNREDDKGIDTAGAERWENQKNQTPSSETGLPSESPESLVREGEAAGRKTGPGSIL
jgi:hypothetical protein